MITIKAIKKYTDTTLEHRWRFLALFLGIFFVTLLSLSSVGFVPQSIDTTGEEKVFASESLLPERIMIPSVGVDVHVENPESKDVAVLDTALQSGAVNYPGTGALEEKAHIFLFGHSSYLPNVLNKNYQAFNGIQKLESGEKIILRSGKKEYVYEVTSVRLTTAEEALLDLRKGVRKLTLSTCNSFGSLGERYVVEADFVESNVIAS